MERETTSLGGIMELTDAYKEKLGVDYKYSGDVVKTEDGSKVETPWILLLAKDHATLNTLYFYVEECKKIGASEDHIDGVLALIDRVKGWRMMNPEKCKIPD